MDALINTVTCCDALDLLRGLPDASVDMVLTDPPYAVHEAKWDKPIDPRVLMPELMRVIKPRGAVVITCVMRLAWQLIAVNPEWFKYDMVVVKNGATDFFNASNKPMRGHENILVFSWGTTANKSPNRMNYYPQMQPGEAYKRPEYSSNRQKSVYGGKGRAAFSKDHIRTSEGGRFPTTTIKATTQTYEGNLHPNQKDIGLFDYLIRSYTIPGETVLDCYAGSGTTGEAARRLSRNYILGDNSPEYCEVMQHRLAQDYTLPLFETLPASE